LEVLKFNTLLITNPCEIKIAGATALVLDEWAYSELVNSSCVLAGTVPGSVLCVGTIGRIFAAVTSWCCVNQLTFSSFYAIGKVSQDTFSTTKI